MACRCIPPLPCSRRARGAISTRGASPDGTRFESSVLAATDVAARKAGAAGAPAPMPAWDVFRPLVATTGVVAALGAVLTPLAARRGRAAAALVAATTMIAT